jgi:hypothetical protein
VSSSSSTSHRTQVAIAVIGAAAVVLAAVLTSGLLSNDGSPPSAGPSNNATGGYSRNTGSCVSGGVVVRGTINCSPEKRHQFEAAYQRQVAATCSAVRRLSKSNTLGTPHYDMHALLNIQPGNVYYFDRERVISGAYDTLAAIKRRLLSLLRRSVPSPLHGKEEIARKRAFSYLRESRAVARTFANALPTRPTLPQINAAAEMLRDREDKATVRLEDALTQLAERDCHLPIGWLKGTPSF